MWKCHGNGCRADILFGLIHHLLTKYRTNMDLDQVKIFVEVVRAGGFSAAARRLGLPRTTVSARVVALEARLKIQLLRRSTRRIVPTESGQALYQQVRDAIETLERVTDSFDSPEAPLNGRIRCTVPQDFPQDLLEKTLISLQRSHPLVRVELLFSNTVSQLVDDDIDVAIRVGRPERQSPVIRRLGGICFAVVASETYLETNGIPVSTEDLKTHRLLAYTINAEVAADSPLRHWARVAKTPVLSSSSLPFLKTMACNGFGITCLPYPLCAQEIATGRLQALEVGEWGLAQEDSIYLVFPSHREMTARVSAFADHFVQALHP